MSAPYGNNNGYDGYPADPINRAPSPYDPVNRAPSPYDPVNRAPSPYDSGNRAPSQYYQQDPSSYQREPASNSYYNSDPQQYDNAIPVGQASPYSESGPTSGSEGERGLLGALGGAAGGGFIGHKTCHGFLGTVGGAIVGSLTEDWAKKHKPLCGKPTPQNCGPAQKPGCNPPGPAYYSTPFVDTHTNVSTSTHLYPGTVQYPTQPPVYQTPQKPCGHQHQCGCQYFRKN
ncbi:hypothetical protein H2198_003646 [Neophaeococcomyces mojaviensis]|uniref:Uncharacterized protein n=1 Tax=Neophaeococcomyces mojaviensis TaxID=3383035 RepID=A0ACC3AB64_9EURO|nr:hypothetical protein H2198_003646 [Knufia sp. JES_112]